MKQTRRQTPKRSKTPGIRRVNAAGTLKSKNHGTRSFVSWTGQPRKRPG